MSRAPRTLLLTARDVERLLSMPEAIRIATLAFRAYARGAARMPPKVYLDLPEYAGDFRAMPAYVGTARACGLKWVNVHPGNPRRGLPMVMAVMLLNDPATGVPLAAMDGTVLTQWRTGAAGGVAARALARPQSRVVGLIGCGRQAETQLAALRVTHRITTVYVWGPDRAETARFVKRVRRTSRRSLRAIVASSIPACVRDADIVVTTTPSRRPLLYRRWLKPGAHINAIGADAPGKRELARDVVESARVIVDDWTQAAHAGEINVPVRQGWLTRRRVGGSLGDVLCGRRRGRRRATDITVFDSTGLAIQDVALAAHLYRRARQQRCGRWVRLLG